MTKVTMNKGAANMMKSTSLSMICLFLLFTSCLYGADVQELVWCIGKVDSNYAEFAIAGVYSDYDSQFASDPVFIVGQDQEISAWPFVQPGPADGWAGAKPHTFTVNFELTEKLQPYYTLLLHLVSAHPGIPPKLEVKVNGSSWQVETEAGTDAAISSASAGTPTTSYVQMRGSAFKTGKNQMTITTASGSWMLYDAVELVAGKSAIPKPTRMIADILPLLYRHEDGSSRLIRLRLVGGVLSEKARVEITIAGKSYVQDLDPGDSTLKIVDLHVPMGRLKKIEHANITFRTNETALTTRTTVSPVRDWEVHLVHQTHLDIGYTHTQEEVLDLQVDHLKNALDYIEKSRNASEEAQFKWHPEGMWAIEEFMRRASDPEKARFLDACRKGQIHLDSMYAQAMTGMYNEEELFELMGAAKRFEREHGISIISAMQTDVPGYTWGLATALVHHGIHYLTLGPNGGHRIGHTRLWGDRPFYWVTPDGKDRVLFWMTSGGYSWSVGSSMTKTIDAAQLGRFLGGLEQRGYPYDIAMIRYGLGGDNGPPNPTLSRFVREWNEVYISPKLIISRNSDVAKELERRYGKDIPVISGDFTPYWEDGCASTSADTGVNRRACEKLVQAQNLWSMLNPERKLHDQVFAAWEKLIMYDEHTWGAHCSISLPDSDFTVRQAEYKQRFALDGAHMTDEVIKTILEDSQRKGSSSIDVYNTSSWARHNELVILGQEKSAMGDRVRDDRGQWVPSQRLASGELAFMVKDIAPFSARRFSLHTGTSATSGYAKAQGFMLTNDQITITIDPHTGAIKSFLHKEIGADLVDSSKGQGINDYLYILGRDATKGHHHIENLIKVTVEDAGPLVAAVSIESNAPGCNKLTRKIRIVSGSDQVECLNIVDKYRELKPEGMYFAYPLNIPNGVAKIDVPWAVVQPEKDQMDGANRNYYCVQRWMDISNQHYGLTWVTIDAPMLQFDPIKIARAVNIKDWRTWIDPGQTFYSWVMNNHWETNYMAYQKGIIEFHYILAPHAHAYNQIKAQQVARDLHQPLLALPANPHQPILDSLFTVNGSGVIVTMIRPCQDGKGLIVRLFNTSEKAQKASLQWRANPQATWLSNPMEDKLSLLQGPVELTKYEVVTLRVTLDSI